MTKPVIYYVRHGQTDWNAELRFQGSQDIPLNDTGRGQARENGRKLAEIFANGELDVSTFRFVASPLGRARETMEIVRGEMGLEPGDYAIDERLIEANYGDWEGATLPEVKQAFPELHKQRKLERWTFAPPNGESHASILPRVSEFYAEISVPSIVVAHGVVGRVLRKHVLGLDGQEAGEFVFPQDRICCLCGESEEFL